MGEPRYAQNWSGTKAASQLLHFGIPLKRLRPLLVPSGSKMRNADTLQRGVHVVVRRQPPLVFGEVLCRLWTFLQEPGWKREKSGRSHAFVRADHGVSKRSESHAVVTEENQSAVLEDSESKKLLEVAAQRSVPAVLRAV
ncbi:hypothetical protein HPB47_010104 [Ixodes persulcatus]|uniref:Uncharacterized protein n=1 Tax=Ixodes persulcatus TaxID=34615 RepID=A0AC60P042_IXOPE|nr:hypothetical protein HPB47_010104 [Ixodes persulcatus]